MALVGYSDSEDSDTEPRVTAPSHAGIGAPKSNTASGKSGFQKVVDRSNPRKIQVALPGSNPVSNPITTAAEDGEEASESNARPAKRPRTGGAFSDFNSMLPAPKTAAKSFSAQPASVDGSGGRMSRARGVGLGVGINLRTGAAPAFSRNQDAEDMYTQAAERDAPSDVVPTVPTVVKPIEPEVKLVGKPNMFKPLSVARKPAKKNATGLEGFTTSEAGTRAGKATLVEGISGHKGPAAPKTKKSLFSTEENSFPIERSTNGAAEYVPLDAEMPTPRTTTNESYDVPMPGLETNHQQPATLGALADSLSLTPAQRRQLFGRNGGEAAAQIANFNLSAEYRHNTELRENGETAPLHNPVRSIAPGKHSLQQLMNMATNQRDALEESFAHGKNNKKEAGSKYGW